MLIKGQENKLPSILKWYQFFVFVILIALISSPFSLISGSSYIAIFWTLFIIFVLPIFIYAALSDNAVLFVFDESKLSISRGILFKNSKIIPYDKIQNVHVKNGPILSLFGLSIINIWTASQSQLQTQGENKPDGRLVLKKEDIQQLQNELLKK